jgi:peroxiredoxin
MALALLCCSVTAEAQAMLHTNVGDRARVITLADLAGAQHSTDDPKGSPRVIAFFTTWSPRSGELLADLAKLHARVDPKGVRMLAVCVDGENLSSDRRREIDDYVKRAALPFPALLDDRLAVYSTWGVVASPTTVLVDAEGMIPYILAGYPSTLRAELEERILALAGIAIEAAPPQVVLPPDESRQLRSMGETLLALGQTDKAMAAFAKAAAADPTSIEPVVMMVRIHLQQGETDPAGKLLASISGEGVNRADYRFLQGMHALAGGRASEASAAFGALSSGSPAEALGRWGAGLVSLAADDIPGGLEHFRAALKVAPPDPLVGAWVFTFARSRWSRGAAFPLEDELVAIFPDLDGVRAKYRRMFGGSLAPAP